MQSAASSTISSSRACQNCSRAKAKCVHSDTADPCTRCSRLNKQCIVPSKSTRKRRSPNTAKSTAQLEQKIESLVTLLSGSHGTLLSNQPPAQATPVEPLAEDNQHRRADHQPAYSWIVQDPPKAQPSWSTQLPLQCGVQPPASSTESSPYSSTLTPSTTPASTLASTCTPSIDIQVDNAEHLLKVYRELYEPGFPFVVLPPNITAQELKARKPWLANTINMVASHENRIRQLAMAKEIIMEAAAALLIRCEKSLDMFESLIVYSVWQFYYAPITPQYQSAAVTQLAVAVLFDLGLNSNGSPDIISDTFRPTGESTMEKRRSLPEMRAYLSCFLITSTVSCSLKRIDCLDYTPYLEHTCESLTESAEFESDLILSFAVRSQSHVPSMSRKGLGGGTATGDIKAPPSMHASSAKADLQALFMALPSKLQEHSLVRWTYHSAEISIYEPSLNRSLFPSHLSSLRLDMMYACLISAKALLDHLILIPQESYYGLSIISLAQIGYGLSIVSKLSMIEVPGWDLAHVRTTVNILQYFDHFISNLEQVGAKVDSSQPTPSKISFCTGCSRAMGRVRGWYEARLAAETEEKQRQEQVGTEDMMAADNLNNYWDEVFFNFNGNWEEIMRNDFMQQ